MSCAGLLSEFQLLVDQYSIFPSYGGVVLHNYPNSGRGKLPWLQQQVEIGEGAPHLAATPSRTSPDLHDQLPQEVHRGLLTVGAGVLPEVCKRGEQRH